jgi:hypothetical protein
MTAASPLSAERETAFRWVAFALAITAGLVEAGWTFRLRARDQDEASWEQEEASWDQCDRHGG